MSKAWSRQRRNTTSQMRGNTSRNTSVWVTTTMKVNEWPENGLAWPRKDWKTFLKSPREHGFGRFPTVPTLTFQVLYWQSPYVERLIGSVRRECLDHVIVFSEAHLRRLLTAYFSYYHRSRTHLSLSKDARNLARHADRTTERS